jgi:peptide/nickel transport system permease protein
MSNSTAVSAPTLRQRNKFLDFWRRLSARKTSVFGLFLVLFLVIVVIFADQLSPYDYRAQDMSNALAFPSAAHLFGTDDYGRDIFSRVLHGGRISLLVSITASLLAMLIGGTIGAIAGFYSGKVDTILMRIMDIFMSIPTLLMAVMVSTLLGTGLMQTAIAVSIGGIAGSARMLRATVLTIRQSEYIEAARAYNCSTRRIILTHIVPNCVAPLIVECTLRIGGGMLMISSLSFIGLGVQVPYAEWGAMLNEGRQYIRDFWPLITFPGIAIVASMLGFNLFGDGLRDALDPKMKQ